MLGVRVWLVELARTKLVKETVREENPLDFPSTHRPRQLFLHQVVARFLFHFN